MPAGGGVARVYVSLPLSGPAAPNGRELLRGARLAAERVDLWLLGTEGIAEPGLVEALPHAVAERTRFFVPHRGPLALYGFEAMALILDAVADAGYDRAGIVTASRTPRRRDGAIGRYAIEADGQVTGTSYGRLTAVDGRLVSDI